MSTQPKSFLTPEQYLELERKAERRSEYFGGEMFAMSGAIRAHNLIGFNLVGELRQQLRKRPCEAYTIDMRVWVSATGLYTYPGVPVVCEKPRFQDDQFDTLLNPTLLAEVLSPSTGSYDRGRKFEHYRTIESLLEYLLIEQERVHAELYSRQADGRWLLSEASRMEDVVELRSIGCRVSLADLYEKVEFPPAA